MMQMKKNKERGIKRALVVPAAAFFCAMLLALPQKSFALTDCEPSFAGDYAESTMSNDQRNDVLKMTAELIAAYTFESDTATAWLQGGIDAMDAAIVAKLDWFWSNWLGALQDMTAQLHAGVIDQSFKLGTSFDANEQLTVTRTIQAKKIDSLKEYQATDQGCQFDTTGKYMALGASASNGVASVIAQDFTKVGDSNQNSPAATGKASLRQSRWGIYQNEFCDSINNNGAAGCSAPPPPPPPAPPATPPPPPTGPPTANLDVLPSETLFAKQTLDTANPLYNPLAAVCDPKDQSYNASDPACQPIDQVKQDSINQLLFNLTGYEPPAPIQPGSLSSTTGLLQQTHSREYLARMDAIGALAYSVVSERLPGHPSPEIQEMREKAGILDASGTPSAREVRQAIIEEVSDPGYYKDLYDSPKKISQKELYLKAYTLSMLYDMISKQEKISNAYAIETGLLLEYSGNLDNAAASAPAK